MATPQHAGQLLNFVFILFIFVGLSVVENFTIHVQDENDAPSNIQFSGPLSFPENSPSGTYLGTAAAVDEDASQTHTYSIVSVIASGHGQIR